MKKVEADADELRPEYDLRSLRVRKLGRGRRQMLEKLLRFLGEHLRDDCHGQVHEVLESLLRFGLGGGKHR